MKSITLLIIALFSISKFCNAQIVLNGNADSIANTLQDKTALKAVYFNPKVSSVEDFITAIQINKTGFKDITVINNFPKDWIKKDEVNYLIKLLHSKIDCKNLKNPLSSHMSKQTALLGDYAFWLVDSYINKTKLDIGLNFVPKSYSKIEKENLINSWKQQVN